MKLPHGEAMYHLKVAIIGLLAISSECARASDVERWTCADHDWRTTWTIAENRMFVAKGKGALQVISNSPSLTVAYDLHKSIDGQAISYVYILDKVNRKLIVYDDSLAAISKGKFGQPFEPTVKSNPCEISK
jgi:hypothetical protein